MIEEFTERFDFEEDSLCEFMYLLIKPGAHFMNFKIMEKREPADHMLVTGFLKWDRCMNWKTNKELLYHYCDINDAKALLECFVKLYELGPKFIEYWDY